MGASDVSEFEQKKAAIEKYMNLLRIEKYGKDELDFQKRVVKMELQIFGISAEELEAGAEGKALTENKKSEVKSDGND